MQLFLLLFLPQATLAAIIQTCHHLPYSGDEKQANPGQYYFCLTDWLTAPPVSSTTYVISLDEFFDHHRRQWQIGTYDMLCTMSGIRVDTTSISSNIRPGIAQGCRVSIQDDNVRASWAAVVQPYTQCQVICIIYRYRQKHMISGGKYGNL
jgi:hypothetical protein